MKEFQKFEKIFSDLYNQGGKYFFTAIKEGDELKFATDDENERHMWVQVRWYFDKNLLIKIDKELFLIFWYFIE